MIARRYLAFAIVLGSSLMACTAIVLGSIGDKDGYAEGNPNASASSSGNSSSGTSSGSTSGAEVSECSLLYKGYSSPAARQTACATCIQSNCGSKLAPGCTDGGAIKDWFRTARSCAQHPYQDYGDPNAPTESASYGCSAYEQEEEPVTGDPGSDTQNKYEADKCIHDACMQGDLPDCKQCEPSHSKGSSGEIQLLRDDSCGKCFTENCPEVLVACCRSIPMEQFVEYCAYTSLQSNYGRCKDIRDAGVPDADYSTSFRPGRSYDADDKACAQKLAVCFLNFCQGKGGCAKLTE